MAVKIQVTISNLSKYFKLSVGYNFDKFSLQNQDVPNITLFFMLFSLIEVFKGRRLGNVETVSFYRSGQGTFTRQNCAY